MQVWYARLLTAGHLKKHADKFQPFIEGLFPGQTVAQFCAAEVCVLSCMSRIEAKPSQSSHTETPPTVDAGRTNGERVRPAADRRTH